MADVYAVMDDIFDNGGANLEHIVTVDNVNKIGYNGETPLMFAVRYHLEVDKIKFLVEERGADPAFGDSHRYTALMLAAALKHLEIVNYLAGVTELEEKERVFYWLTTFTSTTDVLRCLHEQHGVPVDVRDAATGGTALMRAAVNKNLETVQYLCEQGANVNLRDTRGYTALAHAASSPCKDDDIVCKYLCARGVLIDRLLPIGRDYPYCVWKQYRRSQIFALMSKRHPGAQIDRLPSEIFRRIYNLLS